MKHVVTSEDRRRSVMHNFKIASRFGKRATLTNMSRILLPRPVQLFAVALVSFTLVSSYQQGIRVMESEMAHFVCREAYLEYTPYMDSISAKVSHFSITSGLNQTHFQVGNND